MRQDEPPRPLPPPVFEAIPNFLLLPTTSTMSLTAPTEAIYPDIYTAFTSIQAHAKEHGYSRRASRVVFACDCAGKFDSKCKDPNSHSSKQQNTGSKKCGRLVRIKLRQEQVIQKLGFEGKNLRHYSPYT
jgi:hypothetical protein